MVKRLFTSRHPSVLAAVAAVGSLSNAASATPVDTRSILSSAKNLPAEFHADTLLLVINQERTEQGDQWPKDRDGTIATLENAHALAFNAAQKLPVRPVASASESSKTLWLGLPLDRLSLQMTAALFMADLDAARAQKMFERDEKLESAVASCTATVVEDHSRIYPVAAKLLQLQKVPDPKFVEERFDRAKRANSLGPILQMAAEATFTAKDYIDIARWAADAFKRIRGDDQGFTASLGDVDRGFGALRARMIEESADVSGLDAAYAAYLTDNVGAQRCSANLQGSALEALTSVFESSGTLLGLSLVIPEATAKAEAPAEPAANLSVLAAEIVNMVDDADSNEETVDAAQLTTKSIAFLKAVDNAASLGGTSSIYKARLNALLDYLAVAPLGDERSQALLKLNKLITSSSLATTAQTEWFEGVVRLVTSVSTWPDATAQFQTFSKSSQPIIQTYTLLAKEEMIAPIQ